jgi:hypothetical protein
VIRTRSTQKLPMVRRAIPHQAAYQHRCDGDADRGGEEIVQNQGHHLGEVGERGFAAIALPVGVGRETDGCIEGEVRGGGGARPAD